MLQCFCCSELANKFLITIIVHFLKLSDMSPKGKQK